MGEALRCRRKREPGREKIHFLEGIAALPRECAQPFSVLAFSSARRHGVAGEVIIRDRFVGTSGQSLECGSRRHKRSWRESARRPELLFKLSECSRSGVATGRQQDGECVAQTLEPLRTRYPVIGKGK